MRYTLNTITGEKRAIAHAAFPCAAAAASAVIRTVGVARDDVVEACATVMDDILKTIENVRGDDAHDVRNMDAMPIVIENYDRDVRARVIRKVRCSCLGLGQTLAAAAYIRYSIRRRPKSIAIQ